MIKGIQKTIWLTGLWTLITFFQVIGQDKWTMSFPEDAFTNDALLDLSYLNETTAGENGFIKLSEDGNDFVNGNGEPVRFWAIGGGDAASHDAFRPMTDVQLEYYAKFLAKRGVNMIRYHGAIHSVTDDINQVNVQAVLDIWRVAAAMKKEGIYTTISPYWAGHVSNIPAAWGLGDYKGGDKPWEVMFFDEKLKNAYKKWVEYLFTETNTYTGIPLKDDPSVGLIMIKNEDGVFWWTIQDVKPSLMAMMEKHYYNWLIQKYGTIAAAYSAWSNTALEADDTANGKMGLYIIWEATQPQSGGKQARITDQMAFYSETQRNFYTEIYDYYRSMGCKQLINSNNWKTASATRLFDAERWTNDACDVLAVNRYYDPGHIGENSGWRIEPGHKYVGSSVLKNPHMFPTNVKQVAGKPLIVSESAWNLPHKYQAEGPFLIASYMSLTGFDGYYWFSPSSWTYDALPYWDFTTVNGQMPMFRWTVSTPGQIGMFPANALMFRLGMIRQGEVVVHEERTLQSIFEREIPVISEENSFDPNRDDYEQQPGSEDTEVAPIAHLAGRVEVVYEGNPANTVISLELETLLDFTNKKITAINGELVWDYKNGRCLLDAPMAKGFCGFPGKVTTYNLTDVTIKTTNEYVVVNVVAMDNKPISQSEKILIQVGTEYRPTNWSEILAKVDLGGTQVDGFEIKNVGIMPWQAKNSKLSVVINNPNIQSARILNMNGYEGREILVKTDDSSNQKEVMIPSNGMYIIVDTRPAAVLGLNDPVNEDFIIFPNPSEGVLKIQSNHNAIFTRIEVLDMNGRAVKKLKAGKDNYELKLNPGSYLVNLYNDQNLVTSQKVIVR